MPYTTAQVERHYDAMTGPYLKYGQASLALHTPLHGPDTRTRYDALTRSNQLLVEGLGLGPESVVLDAGCGLGGLAFHLADKFGSRVIGISICRSHVRIARRVAVHRGLSHLVRFEVRDFMSTGFEAESFDAVLNQDSFCYASDRTEAYLREVRRILRPGGHWCAIDTWLPPGNEVGPPTITDLAIRRGWVLPGFASWPGIERELFRAGFEEPRRLDLSSEVGIAARTFLVQHLQLGTPAMEDPDNPITAQEVFGSHMAACAAFGMEVMCGGLIYGRVSARAPAGGSSAGPGINLISSFSPHAECGSLADPVTGSAASDHAIPPHSQSHRTDQKVVRRQVVA